MRDRVEEFLHAPAAAAMFVLAARHGLDADRLAEPATVTTVASAALRRLDPWTWAAAQHRGLRAPGRSARLVDALRPRWHGRGRGSLGGASRTKET